MLQRRYTVTAPELHNSLCRKRAVRYIYNERLEEVTYPEGYEVDNVNTELCEVIVQGIY